MVIDNYCCKHVPRTAAFAGSEAVAKHLLLSSFIHSCVCSTVTANCDACRL